MADIKADTKNYLIGLDLGTSVIKGVLLDSLGHIHHTASQTVSYLYPQEGWIEADPQVYRLHVFNVIKQLTKIAPASIDAIAMAGASGNTLLASDDGTPLTNIINWMDQRTAGQLPKALQGLTSQAVRQVTGWPCIDSFSLAHLAWFSGHKSQQFHAATHCCMNPDWILFQLTGNWVLDYSTATPMHLQDQITKGYHPPFLDRLGIAQTTLSKLVPSGFLAGSITPPAAKETGLSQETKVVTGSFDHPMAARAVGVLEPGSLLLSCGTSWVGLFPETSRQKIIDAQLLCDPFLESTGGPWAAMFSIPRIGQMIDTYVRQIIAPGESDPYAVFNDQAQAADADAGGLKIDLREPIQHTTQSRKNISLAVMQGAADLLQEKLRELKDQDIHFTKAVLVGGPSRSSLWTDIVQTTTGLQLSVGTPYAGAKGAAMLAGIATGVFKDEKDAFNQCGNTNA
ncbi:MAG: hypothetical protein JKX85_12300 [Phycisphaeraceae bacterium]|nr:hypothetical protein [Phycisphaeraceae bacterium]